MGTPILFIRIKKDISSRPAITKNSTWRAVKGLGFGGLGFGDSGFRA